MNETKHAEQRAWAFEALDQLEAFLDDPDYEGQEEPERAEVQRTRKQLKEGKYRVVFLGVFNVGKSTLINAFMGDEYLPTVLEECTTKVTRIVRDDEQMKVVLKLAFPSAANEVEALQHIVDTCDLAATVEADPEEDGVVIAYSGRSARAVVATLAALVAASAEERFPQLTTLRRKLEEIVLHIPAPLLEEDIAFIDSPGVYSISESSETIIENVIPNSHLVVCLIDSQSAGNEQNRAFIEKILRHQHRKIFFVINKADQLNDDEIDPSGHRGPARDLIRCLAGVVDQPELFFVSSLYAFVANQLMLGRLTLEDLDHLNKIKIPFSRQRELLTAKEPEKAIAEHLRERSNIPVLRERLLDYLYNENREGAILELTCRFIDGRAWEYARPVDAKLQIAREMPRLEELKNKREHLTAELEDHGQRAQTMVEAFTQMADGAAASGGDLDDETYEGYQAVLEKCFAAEAVEERVRKPLHDWIDNDENFRKAKKAAYEPLTLEVESTLDAFLAEVATTLNDMALDAEHRTLEKATGALADQEVPHSEPVIGSRGSVGVVRAGLGASWFWFPVVGAALFAGIGTALGVYLGHTTGPVADLFASLSAWLADVTRLHPLGAVATADGALGACLGLILRVATAHGLLKERLKASVDEKVKRLLLRGVPGEGDEKTPAAREQLSESLDARRHAFLQNLKDALDEAAAHLKTEIAAVQQEEEKLRREQQETIARLEPKLKALTELGDAARAIVNAHPPRDTVADAADTSVIDLGQRAG